LTIDLKSEPSFALGSMLVKPSACRVSGAQGEYLLQPKVMQVLIVLAGAMGEPVSHERLMSLVWPGVVVGQDVISRTIVHIRRLSKWDGGRSFIVQTVPRIGYALVVSAGAVEPPVAEPLLAVLPFDNLSDDTSLRAFSEGVSEEILQTIAKSTSIRVIGRASSFQFRGERKSAKEIASELRATHMLDGAVRDIGERVRVSAHLMETSTQTMVWSDRFDCARGDLFELEDRIAGLVAAALNRTFARRKRPRAVDPVAYEQYLRGAELCRDIVPESQRQAIALLEAATARMPDFAEAWAELALARAQAGFLRFERRTPGRAQDRVEVQAAAARARALDPHNSTATLIPFVGGALFDFTDHKRRFLQPRPAKLETTAAPDTSLGVQMLEAGRVDEALELFQEADLFDPLFQIQLFYHCHALAAGGHLQRGMARMDEALIRWPPIPFFNATRICWAAMMGDWPTVDRLMAPERLARHPLNHRTSEVQTFVDIARAGDTSPDAFARLRDEAYAIGKSGLEPILAHATRVGIKTTLDLADRGEGPFVDAEAPRRPDDIGPVSLFLPFFADLRQDPLFVILCARLGLAALWCETGRWPTWSEEYPSPSAFRLACERAVLTVR
jgi:adenylate cyclase